MRTMRKNSALRPIGFGFTLGHHADGYCVAKMGATTVLCTAKIDSKVPPHLRGSRSGWVTAEYAMLPNATHDRMKRLKSIDGGRSKEISRLIGRSLRAICNLSALGERQILIDCDVLHADGGTRTTAINGSFIALYKALKSIKLEKTVLQHSVSAVSCALSNQHVLVDPDYPEDSSADADANFVIADQGRLIELQMTAETYPINDQYIAKMLNLAQVACDQIREAQFAALGVENPFVAEE